MQFCVDLDGWVWHCWVCGCWSKMVVRDVNLMERKAGRLGIITSGSVEDHCLRKWMI